jgi:predicted aspartyl protease
MLSVSCGYDGAPAAQGLLVLRGPTLAVNVGFDPHYQPDTNAAPSPGITHIEALVDTGADESCIDSLLAIKLGLPIVDQRAVIGVDGSFDVNMHLGQVHIPALKFTVQGSFAGVKLVAGGMSYQVLIGRTFLRHVRMLYDGPTGAVTISRD